MDEAAIHILLLLLLHDHHGDRIHLGREGHKHRRVLSWGPRSCHGHHGHRDIH
jgi:hypothetical protein